MLSFDFKEEVLKATPIAGTVAGDTVSKLIGGFSINEWFYIAAIAYTVAQIGAKIVDTIINWKTQQSKINANSKPTRHYHFEEDGDIVDDEAENVQKKTNGGEVNDRKHESYFD